MPGRSRTTKKLAQRIDLNYFKRLYAIPSWRRRLSFGLVLVGLLWLGWEALSGKQRPYNAGPVSHAHALLTRNCTACHVAQAVFGRKVTDQACLTCHDAPAHQTAQTFTPVCMDCHVEHQGSPRLASTRDASCTQCHRDLKTDGKPAGYVTAIASFDGQHPEFAPLRPGHTDPGTVRLNHQVHLKKDLRGPNGTLVQVKCADCHPREQADIVPVNFEKHCLSCHPLQFDKRFVESVPHKKPDVEREFMTAKFTEYIGAHPEEVRTADPGDPRTMRPPLPPARNAAEWIARRIDDSERLLWRKTCKECHTLNFGPGSSLPEIPKAAIPAVWMPHAEFGHRAHQMVNCAECHAGATKSQETSDILLPGIQTCRTCHRSGADFADARCSECHLYHDWSKEKKIEGKFTLLGF